MFRPMGFVWGVLTGIIAVAPISVHAETVADFYHGRQLTIIVGAGAGGVYDLYARAIGQFIGHHIPGDPTVVYQFMPGGGGTRSANYCFNAAPKDGSVLCEPFYTVPMMQLLRHEGVKYDAAKFQWIGNMAEINGSLAVWHTVPVQKLLDARKTQVVIGATGTGSETFIDPTIMNALLDTKFKLVMGYRGMADLDLALEKGEIRGHGGALMNWTILRSDWLKQKKVRILAQVGLKKSADGPDIPLLTDFARNDDDRTILEFISSRASIGRSLVAPPGVSADRVAALRKAFDATMKDPAFLAAALKRKILIQPSSWQEVSAVVRKTLATPKRLVEKTSKILGFK